MKNILLLGNPNCGKTTLFNTLTKSHRITGNRIGVTVDAARGIYKCKAFSCEITDLPGIYSLSPFTEEEKVVSDYLKNGEYDSLIYIVDSQNPERSLPLLLSLIKLKKPLTLAFNFADICEKQGIKIDTEKASELFGVSCVCISASKGRGLDELMRAAFTSSNSKVYTESIYAPNEYQNKFKDIFTGSTQQKSASKTAFFDKIALGKYTAYPLMLAVTALIFIITFSGVSKSLSDALNQFFTVTVSNFAEQMLLAVGSNYILISLVCDGIIGGIGSVLSFLPQITVLTVLMAVFEDSGYLSRTAFISDFFMRKFGLQGKCFFCVMMGFGCSVPAIMSTRVLETRRERIRTILLIPFMPCSAKLPLFVMMSSLFFSSSPLFVILLYVTGALIGFIYIFLLKKAERKKHNELFFLEMPAYRMPSAKSIRYSVITRIGDFALKAGTILTIASVFMWLLSSFDLTLNYTDDSSCSILAVIGEKLLILFKPLGLTEWKQSAALISGLFAREAIVSSLEILYNGDNNALAGAFTQSSAAAVCVFSLLFTPCVAALTAMRRELKSNTVFVAAIAAEALLAYIISTAVYFFGRCIFGA